MSTVAQDRARLLALEERLHRFYREHLLVSPQRQPEQAEEPLASSQQQPQDREQSPPDGRDGA